MWYDIDCGVKWRAKKNHALLLFILLLSQEVPKNHNQCLVSKNNKIQIGTPGMIMIFFPVPIPCAPLVMLRLEQQECETRISIYKPMNLSNKKQTNSRHIQIPSLSFLSLILPIPSSLLCLAWWLSEIYHYQIYQLNSTRLDGKGLGWKIDDSIFIFFQAVELLCFLFCFYVCDRRKK